ncbi:MAG: lactonase family protein [Acidobacteriia bacterium]|nr:lactonase family protein [Terriglobia bacterium]
MKALILSLVAISVLLLVGCGGGGPVIHIGSPVGPFVLTVSPASSNVSSFKGSNSGAISPISSPAAGTSPSAILLQSPEIDLINVFVTDSATNRLTLLNLDFQSGVLTNTGFSVPVGSNPMGLALWGGATVANAPQPQFGFVYVLNQGSSSISVFNITDRFGHLSEVPGSPFATPPNPQAVTVANLGDAINVSVVVYVAAGNQQLAGYHANADGSLTALPALGVSAGTNISWVAARGLFLYASDTANNQILGFKIQSNGSLVAVGPGVPAGAQPGAINANAFSTFLYAANQGSNNISGYRLDPVTGVLTPLAGFPVATGTTPVNLSAVDGRQHMYVANQGSNNLSAFSVDFNTGALTPIPGSPFPVAASPRAVEAYFVMNVD